MRRLAFPALAGLIALTGPALAAPKHGLSAFGELALPADFTHLPYVNPDAPKGGRITTLGTAGRITFDSLNGYILKGEPAQHIDLLFDSLMTRNEDEPDAVYALAAKQAEVAADGMSVTFWLDERAKFSDGSQLTSADVCNTFTLLKEDGLPQYAVALQDVEACVTDGPAKLSYSFTGSNVRDLPLTVAQLPIFSKAYYTENEFDKTTLEPPLGSGPYKVKDLNQGSFITYERRDDYWAKDLPVNRGRHNFGEIKLLYFRDRTTELEALKAGKLDLREEFTSKSWATEYDLDSVKEGRLIKATLPDERASGAQGFFLNMRRDKFSDVRVRQALDLAFDFEWTNKNLFFDAYRRTGSFFENSVMRASGKPGPDELALLEPLRDKLPAEVFGEAYEPPVSNGSGQDRKLLRQAAQLLDAAGWAVADGVRVNDRGEPLTIEFLIFAPTFERVIAPYVRNLKLLGIDASIRQVEAAQYQERLKSFDFDVLVQRYSMSQTPGVEMKAFFSSATADVPGSFNLSGLKSEAVDALIDNIMQANDRESLAVAARALDRVLRAEQFWVPQWFKGAHTLAYWDIFGLPENKPKFGRAVLDTWWIDADKAASVKRGP
jgi:microcin C transport system substrate-binding protein